MIERLWELWGDLWAYLGTNFDPYRDILDILLVTFGIYWLLVLIRGTRAVQILVGLVLLIGLSVLSDALQLVTVRLILDIFLPWAGIIVVILFQNDIRRALARMGRGFFPSGDYRESQMVEEVVRAAQTLAQKQVGALIVLERENALDDQIEAGTPIDSGISKELLTSIFLPYSPLHDGAVVIQNGRAAYAGCILPLTLRDDLPEGVGTRHRAAVGITEETDAVVIVVSEETASISVVMGGAMKRDLDAPRLRVILRDILAGERTTLAKAAETADAAIAQSESPTPPPEDAAARPIPIHTAKKG